MDPKRIRRTPFIHEYPWRNGVVFADSALRTWVIGNTPDSVSGNTRCMLEVSLPFRSQINFISLGFEGSCWGSRRDGAMYRLDGGWEGSALPSPLLSKFPRIQSGKGEPLASGILCKSCHGLATPRLPPLGCRLARPSPSQAASPRAHG